MKRTITTLLIGLVLGIIVSLASTAYADDVKQYILTKVAYPLFVNGKEASTIAQPVLNYDGTTYVPLKLAGDLLGVKVQWNDELQRVEIGEVSQPAAANTIRFEDFTITGDPNGIGTLESPKGISYHGELRSGFPFGQGDMTYNGTHYTGDFKGVSAGKGTIYYIDKSRYEGEWDNFVPNGYGTKYNQDGILLDRGVFKDGVYDSVASIDRFKQKIKDYMSDRGIALNAYDVSFNGDYNYSDKFIIAGTATLGKTFEYGFNNDTVKAGYFNVKVVPVGEGSSQGWNLYFPNDKFKEFHDLLKNSSISSLKVVATVTVPSYRDVPPGAQYAEVLDADWE